MARPTPQHRALRIANAVGEIDRRLHVIAKQLKTIQPKRTGAILLEAYSCGHNCLGCPHYRWDLWLTHPGRWPGGEPAFLCHRIAHPLRHLPHLARRVTSREERGECLWARVEATRAAIETAQSLLRRRAALIRLLDQFRRTSVAAERALDAAAADRRCVAVGGAGPGITESGDAPPAGGRHSAGDASSPPQARRLAVALGAVRILKRIDARLLVLASILIAAQPARRGRVKLRQTVAGRWCWIHQLPHPRCRLILEPEEVADPGRHARGSPQARDLIREAKRLLGYRRKLISALATAGRLSATAGTHIDRRH